MTSPLQSKVQPQNGVGCAFPLYPVQKVCAAALQLAPLIYAGIWNSGYINKTIFVVHTVSFSAMSNWRHQGSFIGEKVPDNGPFRDPFWTGMGHIAPLRDKSHTQTIYRWTTNIVQFVHAKVWLRHCSQRCHLRTAARQGWVCLSDTPCSRCPRSWSAAYSPKLYKNVQLWVSKRSNICRSHS